MRKAISIKGLIFFINKKPKLWPVFDNTVNVIKFFKIFWDEELKKNIKQKPIIPKNKKKA